MALIEGVGDEVTLLFAALLLISVLLLAWISTRTAEPSERLFAGDAPTQGTVSAHQDPPFTSAGADVSDSSSSVQSTEFPAASVLQDKAGEDGASGQDRSTMGGATSSLQRNMVVRLKFLDDTETMAQVQPQDTVGYIKRTYFPGQEQQIRLIYQGQLLQDDAQTLQSLNLGHNCVLHCHISQHTARSSTATAAGPRQGPDQVQVALNVGSLMVPLLVMMLSVLWYCQIQYRQFFTAPATASLVGVTILISLVAFGVYRR